MGAVVALAGRRHAMIEESGICSMAFMTGGTRFMHGTERVDIMSIYFPPFSEMTECMSSNGQNEYGTFIKQSNLQVGEIQPNFKL